jgi:hypothetical protein
VKDFESLQLDAQKLIVLEKSFIRLVYGLTLTINVKKDKLAEDTQLCFVLESQSREPLMKGKALYTRPPREVNLVIGV